jgi:alkaline phosphatase D
MTRRDLRLPLSRREFMQLTMTAAAVVAGSGCDFSNPLLPSWPFTLGVASGDPLSDRVVLWTRLAPDPLSPDGAGGMPDEPVQVVWQVAHDEQFQNIARIGAAIAHPSLAHSVHVDVNGLEPDRWYFYRFLAGSHVSPVGRARTFPRIDQAPALMRFASASCQHFATGYYTSHAALAQEDLDFVAFLGDYIYEGASSGPVRAHVGGRIVDLPGYRNRYAQYKGDVNLQEAHARFPWIVTWDDHEVANNYADGIPDEAGPIGTLPPAEFAMLRAAGYQAWYEHQPVRSLPPKGPTFPIHRSLDFGDLARVCVLDTRQFRTNQECTETAVLGDLGPPCDGFPDAAGTLLGAEQEAWLYERLGSSSAIWNVLAQQIVFSPTPIATLVNFDQWDGYPAERARIIDFLQTQAIRNPVVLTGDIHAAGAGWVPADTVNFADPVASEFVATGISSGGLDPSLADLATTVIGGLPHVHFFDAIQRGYVRHVVERDQWRADFRFVATTAQPTSSVATGISFVVADGNPDPQLA